MRIRTSILAKGLAWILIAASGMGILASGFMAIGMEQSGFYSSTYEKVRDERFETFHDRYSARVLDYLGEKEIAIRHILRIKISNTVSSRQIFCLMLKN